MDAATLGALALVGGFFAFLTYSCFNLSLSSYLPDEAEKRLNELPADTANEVPVPIRPKAGIGGYFVFGLGMVVVFFLCGGAAAQVIGQFKGLEEGQRNALMGFVLFVVPLAMGVFGFRCIEKDEFEKVGTCRYGVAKREMKKANRVILIVAVILGVVYAAVLAGGIALAERGKLPEPIGTSGPPPAESTPAPPPPSE